MELKVNGQGPYRFLVDTGTDGTCITPLVAREARIPASGVTTVLTGDVGAERVACVTIDRLEADSFSLRGVGANILSPETSRLQARSVDRNWGGLIGMSALQNVLLEIDFPLRKISVARIGSSRLTAADGLPYLGIIPYVTIATPSIKHPTTSALLDTGFQGSFAFTDIASYPARVGLIKRDEFSAGIGGHWRARFGQLNGKIRLGPAIWRDPEIHEGQTNLIGSAALGPWKLVINPAEKKLWLLNGKLTSATEWTGPLDPDGRPAVYGFAWVSDGEAFIVMEVDPGSRAERAGLKVGDRCWREKTAVPATNETPLDDSFGIRLSVVRGSEKFTLEMSLASSP